MTQWYTRWNQKLPVILWGIIVLAILATLPLVYDRVRTESSAKKVEFVFNYRNLLDISDYKSDPRQFVDTQLNEMKKAGIKSLAVFESTLNELRQSRRVQLYNAHDAAALTQTTASASDNFTYVLFTTENSAQQKLLQGMIEQSFQRINVRTRPWTHQNQPGLVIEMPLDEALLKSMDPDPITMQMLKDKGFQIVIRLSNRRDFDPQRMDILLAQLADQYGVKMMIVDGDEVPGYSHTGKSTENIAQMADLMNKHNIGLAAIEPVSLKTPQKGVTSLTKDLYYHVVRLHSFSEQDADKLTENLTAQELNDRIQGVSDRFVLAAKDRNIRMIFLNGRAVKNVSKGSYVDPLDAIYASLRGTDGAIHRIAASGYTPGIAHAFTHYQVPGQNGLKLLTILGSVAIIAMGISYFFPSTLLGVFIVGAIGALGLNFVAPSALYTVLALAVGVFAVTLAMMTAVKTIRKQKSTGEDISHIGFALILFIRTTILSGIGAIFIVGLLNDITYNLLIQQFKGVNVLAFAPVVFTFLYLLFFSEGLTTQEKVQKAGRLLTSKISVLWILSAAVAVGAGYYYLTRTGNTGQASSLEMMFRSFLENTLQVRPRTKEFLIGTPLFILGAYLSIKYRLSALYMVLIGAVAQASIVGTFTHLHTPLYISIIRVSYGMGFGTMIGLALIVIWELCAKGWRTWIAAETA